MLFRSTFNDRNEDEITLRPEYTTPMIRAAISNSLLNNLPAKFFGTGQMFRRERPQKGRYKIGRASCRERV